MDVSQFLEAHSVRYGVVDGLAASFLGEPRVNADVDMVMQVDDSRALELLNELTGTPLQPLFSGVEEVVQSAFILPLRHVGTGVKVDLALGMSGFEQQLIARAQPMKIGTKDVNFATAEDLLVMKLLA